MFHCIFFFQLISSSLTITTTNSLLPFIIGSINSLVLLGDIYFEASKVQEGLKKIEKSSRKDLPHHRHHVYWYSRASSYGHPLGSFYTAMVYQFGFGVPKNLYRASRYVYVIFLPLFIIFSTIRICNITICSCLSNTSDHFQS